MPLRNVVVIGLSMVISVACYTVAAKNRYANLFAEALSLIQQKALQDVQPREMFNSAMTGLMSSLDEHSMYISGHMFRAFDEDMKQQFGGVGMYVETEPETQRLIVLAPIPDTPAFRAGIQIGDEIAEIDGQPTRGMSRSDAIKLMRGPDGTSVGLLIRRGQESMPMQLTRATIPVPSVHGDSRNPNGSWSFVLQDYPRIGYLRLLQFGEKSTAEIVEALAQLEGRVDGLILDLRNNSGGLLEGAIEICDLFLNQRRLVVSTRGRENRLIDEHFSTAETKFDSRLPLVVLVNRNSASASEIVAACLQDYGRAVIIGEQTWGKGTVQNIIPVERGQSAMKLTTASYWRPNGHNIDRDDPIAKQTERWGVQPDAGFAIELTDEMIFDNVRRRNQRDLEGLINDSRNGPEQAAAANQDAPAIDGPPASQQNGEEAAVLEQPPPYVDLPLQRAIEYLNSKAQAIAA